MLAIAISCKLSAEVLSTDYFIVIVQLIKLLLFGEIGFIVVGK